MADCICPKCGELFAVASRRFGTGFHCPVCSHEFQLGVDHLARFQLPGMIVIRLVSPGCRPEEMADIVVLADYGGQLPPIRTDRRGEARFPRELFLKHIRQNAEAGLMEDRDRDYGLIRFIRFTVSDAVLLAEIAERRKSSGWPILSLERELFGDLNGLLNAYTQNANALFKRAECVVDLYRAPQDVRQVIELESNS